MTEEVKSGDDAKPRLARDEAIAIANLTGMNHDKNSESDSGVAIRRMVVAEVVNVYTQVDRLFDLIISRHFVVRPLDEGRPDENWLNKLRDKQTQFRQLVLDNLTHLNKMKAVNGISTIHGDIQSIIHQINTLRNDLAHSAQPWDRRPQKLAPSTSSFSFGGQVAYNKVNIYSEAGVKELQKDFKQVEDCLVKIALSL